MAITSYVSRPIDDAIEVTVQSTLTNPWYHWYADGLYQGGTRSPTRLFRLQSGGQARIEVLDTIDENFDPIANAPSPAARRKIWWIRSLDTGVDYYRVDQQQDGGAWQEIARMPVEPEKWYYQIVTDRLDDLSTYEWRVVPVDAAGNSGTAILTAQQKMVRTPDAPNFTISYDSGTQKVTFDAA